MRKKLLICIILILAFALALQPPGGDIARALTQEEIDSMTEDALNSDDPQSALRDLMQFIQEQMETVEGDITAKEQAIGQFRADIVALEAELVTLSQQVAVAQQAIDLTVTRIAQATEAIMEAEARLEERLELFAGRVSDIYVYGNIDMLDVIFESTSFEDFLILYDMAELIMLQDKDLVNQITKERNLIEASQKQLEKDLDSQITLQNELRDKQADLDAVIAAKDAQIGETNLTIEELNAQLDAWDGYFAAAGDAFRELQKNSDSSLSFGGSMVWPLPSPWGPGYITSPYGWRDHPITHTQRFHAGIDIGADGGTAIYATAAGKVLYVGWQGGYGNTVMIDHGSGVGTLYGHMSSFASFSTGDYVVPYDIIGYVGTTGASTGNHLHFEVRVNGDHADPQPYLNY